MELSAAIAPGLHSFHSMGTPPPPVLSTTSGSPLTLCFRSKETNLSKERIPAACDALWPSHPSVLPCCSCADGHPTQPCPHSTAFHCDLFSIFIQYEAASQGLIKWQRMANNSERGNGGRGGGEGEADGHIWFVIAFKSQQLPPAAPGAVPGLTLPNCPTNRGLQGNGRKVLSWVCPGERRAVTVCPQRWAVPDPSPALSGFNHILR